MRSPTRCRSWPPAMPRTARPGQPDDSSADAAMASIRQAVGDVLAGRASAVVTNPIAKSVLYRAGFRHPGHTEFLAELAADRRPCAAAGDDAVVPCPRRGAGDDPSSAARRDRAAVERPDRHHGPHRGRGLEGALRARHAAPGGIRPQSPRRRRRLARHRGAAASWRPPSKSCAAKASRSRGPLPADTMFHDAARKTYDCAICMYHDQALIPVKTLAFDDAVNVTLGLPFIRTSPDHGTAFDIAGTGRANPSSLIAALRLAARMAAAHSRHERDRRPSAASRGHSPARVVGPQIARTEFPAGPQPHRADRARRRAAGRCDHRRDRPGSRRADARLAGVGRAARHRRRARSARAGGARGDFKRAIRGGWRSSAPTRSISIRGRCSAASPPRSSPTCPTTSRPRC